MDKALVHIMTKSRMKSDVFSAELDNMEDLSEKYGVKNFIFYKGEPIEYKDFVNKLEKLGIVLKNYANKEELKEYVLELNKECEVAFVSTPMELLVNVMNEIKEALGHPVSDNPEVFRDKHLQRKLIQDHNPDLGIKFMKGEPTDLKIEEIEEKVGYPFIIKPVDGLQSSGVEKIEDRDDFEDYMKNYQVMHDRLKSRGIDNKILIVEEYIDGKMYSIDYFVTPEGEPIISKPVKVRLGTDYGFEDYCNTARISSEKTEKEFKGKRMKTFINQTVKATGIRNTFVHHELKINSKGEVKTIELNGRIGGGRLEVIKSAYDLNLYELIFNYDAKPGILKYNNIAVNIYATKGGILKGFNEKLLKKVGKRETVYNVELEECCVDKEIGLTKDGFVKVGAIKMQDKDYKKVRKDYLFIKRHYEELLIIE